MGYRLRLLLPALLLLCTACEKAAPKVSLGESRVVLGCELVAVEAEIFNAFDTVEWSYAGLPLLYLEPSSERGVFFRAPVVNMDTPVEITVTVTNAGGKSAQATQTFTIAAAGPRPGLGAGMAPGCLPFPHGVASGDPRPDSLRLWTRVSPGIRSVRWVLARDAQLLDIVDSGRVEPAEDQDRSVHLTVENLQPGTTYYYRFSDDNGGGSVLGRTRTTGIGTVERVRFAVGSCSSVWSGYFNGYARIAERADLDFVLHLGDFVYDFADANEPVRLPTDGVSVERPSSRAAWHERFRYYLSDPDLRRARQAHPFIVIWDNHDSNRDPDERDHETVRAFRDFVPMEQPDPDDHRIGYRAFQFGDLAQLMVLDTELHRIDGPPETADRLGDAQWAWLDRQLDQSRTTWRILGSQGLMTHLTTPDIGGAEPSDLDDYPMTRSRLYQRLGELGDNLVVSGDLHFSVAVDLVEDPSGYDPQSGAGAVGGELLATSFSRGNFDEELCNGPCTGTLAAVIESAHEIISDDNAHLRFLELIEHGYGIVDVVPERIVAEIWFSEIRALTRDEELGVRLEMPRGHHRWDRPAAP